MISHTQFYKQSNTFAQTSATLQPCTTQTREHTCGGGPFVPTVNTCSFKAWAVVVSAHKVTHFKRVTVLADEMPFKRTDAAGSP